MTTSFRVVSFMQRTSIAQVHPLSQVAGFGLFGGMVGWATWGTGEDLLALLCVVVLPVAFGIAKSRWIAGALMLGYYMAGARGLPGGAAVFFGDAAPWGYGWALYGAACVLLALPYMALWSFNKTTRGWRFLTATIVVAVPPIGLLGWCNPLTVAGTLFPGTGWIGLLLTSTLFLLLAGSPQPPALKQRYVPLFVIAALGLNLGSTKPAIPGGWIGVDTSFARLASAGNDDAGQVLASMARVQWVKQFAETVAANETVVLPETILGSYGGIAEFNLWPVGEQLAARGSRLLVGAELPQTDGRYFNSLLVLGDGGVGTVGNVFIRQGIPVPVTMWLPWSKSDGAIGDIWGKDSTIVLNGQHITGLICYEQLLPWAILQRLVQAPTIVVAASNVWWARNTSIPVIQRQTVSAFARLFGVPVVGAVNG